MSPTFAISSFAVRVSAPKAFSKACTEGVSEVLAGVVSAISFNASRIAVSRNRITGIASAIPSAWPREA